MLVPGLGFGRDGARIGFGAGHYDRALATRARDSLPVLVGVCFAEFLDPSDRRPPTQAHDVNMDWVLTELGLERCGG
jgi:5-formyltetrahydrofolate cyclo-ligase